MYKYVIDPKYYYENKDIVDYILDEDDRYFPVSFKQSLLDLLPKINLSLEMVMDFIIRAEKKLMEAKEENIIKKLLVKEETDIRLKNLHDNTKI